MFDLDNVYGPQSVYAKNDWKSGNIEDAQASTENWKKKLFRMKSTTKVNKKRQKMKWQ